MAVFSKACTAFGLTISMKKTKVMYTPCPGEAYVEQKRVWSDHGITVNTKLGVYNACVLSCPLNGSETSTTGVTSNALEVPPELSSGYHEDLLALVYAGYRCSRKSWHV